MVGNVCLNHPPATEDPVAPLTLPPHMVNIKGNAELWKCHWDQNGCNGKNYGFYIKQ